MIETFEKNGLGYKYLPAADYQTLSANISEATGIVVATRISIDKKILDLASRLQWIARLGSGMEHIDTSYAKSKNINCISSPEGNSNAVAEHALGMLLSLVRNISKSAAEIKEMKWLRKENRGIELNGKVAGIIGYGNTGSGFARLLTAMGMTVLVYDKYKYDFGNESIKEANPEQIASYADIISFHLPYNEETRYFANESFFSSLKQKPYIINTSRGMIVDTAALIDALKNNLVSGAALDVLENEKLSSLTDEQRSQFDWLNSRQDVLLTPHIAGYTHEAAYKMSKVLLEKLGLY